MDKKRYVHCLDFSGVVYVADDTITDAPPRARGFIGKHVSELIGWARRRGAFFSEEI